MAKKKKENAPEAKSKDALMMVFGENDNDTYAIRSLVSAIWKDAPKTLHPPIKSPVPKIQTFRSPLVQIRGRSDAQQRKSAVDIANVVKATSIRFDVKAVFAHEDCDQVEPSHVKSAAQIEARLAQAGVPNPVGVTPAWESEAWWYLWPTEVAEVNPNWAPLGRKGTSVGLLKDAKETLTKELRPPKGKTRDYMESDSRKIADAVLKNSKAFTLNAKSDSYTAFRDRVVKLAQSI